MPDHVGGLINDLDPRAFLARIEEDFPHIGQVGNRTKHEASRSKLGHQMRQDGDPITLAQHGQQGLRIMDRDADIGEVVLKVGGFDLVAKCVAQKGCGKHIADT